MRNVQAPIPGRLSPPALVFGLILCLYWILVGLVLLVDPYDLYPWGLQPRLAPDDTLREDARQLVRAVAKNGDIDTVVLGGSTMVMYTPAQLKRWFPAAREIANVSYYAPRPLDRDVVSREILKSASLKHVLLTLDHLYLNPPDQLNTDFPLYLYDREIFNDLRGANADALRRALALLSGRAYGSAAEYQAAEAEIEREYRDNHTRRTFAAMARSVAAQRSAIDTPSRLACADLATLNAQLLPFAQNLAQRGIALDIIIPPYNPVYYYVNTARLGPSGLNDQLTLRRCLVNALAGFPGVRIFAFDNEPWTLDFANFKDPGHLHDAALTDYVMDSVAVGRHRLTLENVVEYIERLAATVKNYQVTDSALAGEHDRGA